MLYEIRSYILQPGAMPQFEKEFAEALPHREKYSKLAGCWHTEIGPLNQIIHMWGYDDLKHRTEVREAAMKDPHWPPNDGHLIVQQESEIMVPAPFMSPIEPGHYGHVYEMRMYNCAPGSMPEIMKRWGEKIPGREEFSKCFACGYTDLGTLSKLIHIWPYESMEERARIRQAAIDAGAWPPNSGEFINVMQNKIMVPSSFSPAH